MLCKECNQYEVSTAGFINQPKDKCFECWFKQDIVHEDKIKPYFTNKEVRKILLWFGGIIGTGCFLVGLLLGITL